MNAATKTYMPCSSQTRAVDPVPVHADPVLDVLVVHADLEQVTLGPSIVGPGEVPLNV